MWVEFVVGSLLCSERCFSGYSGFPLSSKTTFPNSNSTRNQVDQKPLCGCATSKSLFIYLNNFRSYALKRTPYIILNCTRISPLQVRSLKVTLFVVTWGVDGQELKFISCRVRGGFFLVRCRCLAKWCYTGQITLNLRTKNAN